MQRKSLHFLMLSGRSLQQITKERNVLKDANNWFSQEYALHLVLLKTYSGEQFTKEEVLASGESLYGLLKTEGSYGEQHKNLTHQMKINSTGADEIHPP